MSEEETEEIYLKLGYQSQSDYFDKRLPIYNDFLSFEEYSKQLEAKTIPPDIIEQLDDTEIKFSEIPFQIISRLLIHSRYDFSVFQIQINLYIYE